MLEIILITNATAILTSTTAILIIVFQTMKVMIKHVAQR